MIEGGQSSSATRFRRSAIFVCICLSWEAERLLFGEDWQSRPLRRSLTSAWQVRVHRSALKLL